MLLPLAVLAALAIAIAIVSRRTDPHHEFALTKLELLGLEGEAGTGSRGQQEHKARASVEPDENPGTRAVA